jgi:hypothetical protein
MYSIQLCPVLVGHCIGNLTFYFLVGESSTKKDTINFFPARRTDTVDQNSKIEKNGCDLNVSEQRRRARESQLKKIEEKIARKKCSKTSSGCLLAQKKIGTLQKQRIQLKRLGSPVSTLCQHQELYSQSSLRLLT